VSLDLLMGRLGRDWSAGIDLSPRPEAPTPSEGLALAVRQPAPKKPGRSVERMIKDRVREASSTAMELYEEYRPTYRDKQVVLRMKTDFLKGMLG